MFKYHRKFAAITVVIGIVVGASLGGWALAQDPHVDAQEAYVSACQLLDNLDSFELDATVQYLRDGRVLETGRIHIRFSGDAYHDTAYSEGKKTSEFIQTGGRLYSRVKGEDWVLEDYTRELTFPGSKESICPNLINFTLKGHDTIRGTAANRYTAQTLTGPTPRNNEDIAPGDFEARNWQIWINDIGYMAQVKVDMVYPDLEGGSDHILEHSIAYSGFNEGEAITAPTIP